MSEGMKPACGRSAEILQNIVTVHSRNGTVIEWVGDWGICYSTDIIVADWPGTGTCCDVTSAGGRPPSAPVPVTVSIMDECAGTASRRHYIKSLVGHSLAVSAIFLVAIAAVIARLDATKMTHRVQKLCATHQLSL